jgi:hypothetical protein
MTRMNTVKLSEDSSSFFSLSNESSGKDYYYIYLYTQIIIITR